MMASPGPRTCALCGETLECPDDGLPAGGTILVEDGETRYLCQACGRRHIRDIEAKLPEEYWASDVSVTDSD